MKRHITELEKSLISKGWFLDRKVYYGKHSDKVLHYVYIKWVYNELKAEVILDKKRNNILDVRVANELPPFVNLDQLDSLKEILMEIRQSVQPDYKIKEENNEEIVEIVGDNDENCE